MEAKEKKQKEEAIPEEPKEVEIPEEISVGDIICFRAKEEAIYRETITHRVISKIYGQDGTLYLETRGDANMVSDGHLVSAENLIGEVIWYSGSNNIISKLAAIITTGQGFFTFVLIPIAVIAVFIMRDSVKSINQELHTMKQELAKQEAAREVQTEEQPYTTEEYIALEERLRREILEELLKNAEMEDAGNIHGQ